MNLSGSQVLVSVIIPVFNGGMYVGHAIESVLRQSHTCFELLIINDGSTDETEMKIHSFSDPRIRYFRQERRGVAAARNAGLEKIQGEYFCFLDADDILPDDSLESRLKTFAATPDLSFVDGTVEVYDATMQQLLRTYRPSFEGKPFKKLLQLNSECFFGPTWMVRRISEQCFMDETLTHGEDLLFYMLLARHGGSYGYTPSVVLRYRSHATSAMRNLDGLHSGYLGVFRVIRQWPETTFFDKIGFRMKVKKMMLLSYLARRQYKKAVLSLFK